jgi:AraC family transcriptional regulator, regulatory protein of adaptative response / methylated-DNA-[protein]-cysteine methyltransferase
MTICSANIPLTKQARTNAEDVTYTTGKSDLDTVLVARSASGICGILIGDGVEPLKRDLAAEFPDGTLVREDQALRADLDKILTFIKSPVKGPGASRRARG